MGYTTEFSGHIAVQPALNANEIAYINQFSETRRMKRTKGPYFVLGSGPFGQGDDNDIQDYNNPPEGQPGLWCQWQASEDGTKIEWNGAEKFYHSLEWMTYLIDHFLKPGAIAKDGHTHDGKTYFSFSDHVLTGVIEAQGEDDDDHGFLVVEKNAVRETRALPGGLKLLAAS